MSSYPPPPPPPPGGPFGPNTTSYNRAVWKAQRQAAKQQEKWARQQMKMQRRAMRPRSIVGPLAVLALGIVFLLAQMGRISWAAAADWYGHWWPLVLVAAGVVLLAEWALDQHAHTTGQPYRGRTLGGGVIFLLILLAFLGVSSREAYRHFQWGNQHYGFFSNMDAALGDEHDFEDSLSASVKDGSTLLIRNPHGDVTVTGSSEDGKVHVSVHKEVHARSDESATEKSQELQPKFSGSEGSLTLDVPSQAGGQADLTIQVPHNTLVTVSADHGDVDIEEIHGDVSVSANQGAVNLSGITGAVTSHINDEHSNFAAHSVSGTLSVDGRMADINISDVTGRVSVTGDFFGNTHAKHVNGPFAFKSSRTSFEVARLDGELDLDSDSLNADQLLGPLQLTTKYGKDITLDRVQGDTQISNNGKGTVSVTTTTPLATMNITNHDGDVDLGVPENAGFVVNAETKDGSVENDFGLKQQDMNDKPTLKGTVAGGGPHINIMTGNGDITVRKATVAPLPPMPPLPKISPMPPMPKIPPMPKVVAPATPAKVVAPATPAKPAAPSAPSSPDASR
jgi:hypothetical protein